MSSVRTSSASTATTSKKKRTVVRKGFAENLVNPILMMNGGGILVGNYYNGTVTLVGGLPLEEFRDLVTKKQSIASPLLPRNCIRYSQFTSKAGVPIESYLLEYPPNVVNLKQVQSYDIDGKSVAKHYELALPYIYLYATISELDKKYIISNLFLFCRESRISNLNDKLAILPLPNIYTDSGKICWGSNNKFIPEVTADNRCAVLEQVINIFMTSDFNRDLGPVFPVGSISSFENWQALSKDKTKWPELFVNLSCNKFLTIPKLEMSMI